MYLRVSIREYPCTFVVIKVVRVKIKGKNYVVITKINEENYTWTEDMRLFGYCITFVNSRKAFSCKLKIISPGSAFLHQLYEYQCS